MLALHQRDPRAAECAQGAVDERTEIVCVDQVRADMGEMRSKAEHS